jgi:hypothetical protein
LHDPLFQQRRLFLPALGALAFWAAWAALSHAAALASTPAANGAAGGINFPQVVTTTPTSTPTRLAGSAIYWGAYIEGATYGYGNAPYDIRTMDAFEANTGKAESIVHWGQGWFYNGAYQSFNPAMMDRVRNRGSIPLLDWSSWDACCGVNQPTFSLQAIIDGNHDAYIRTWATAARNWGHPFFLRMDHEMNGDWYPWSEVVNGNSQGQYVRAWRHVHDIFTQLGATNVTWVWCINREYPGSQPLDGLYPGDAYVDWVSADIYNRYPTQWQSFYDLFRPGYDRLVTIAPSKLIMIAETSSIEEGGSKANWITEQLGGSMASNFPRVKALVWFNWVKNGLNWTIESSTSAQSAFHNAIASPYYLPNNFANLNVSPIPDPDLLVTRTPSPTATATRTPITAVLIGHATWQGPPGQPDPRQQLPITLTLSLGNTETNYPAQNTDAQGFFTVTVSNLAAGTYTWRAKGPRYLSNSGTVSLSGAAVTRLEMGLMRAGDANNDNLVGAADFAIVKRAYGTAEGDPAYDARADFNNDRLINTVDFTLLKANFGSGGASPINSGP